MSRTSRKWCPNSTMHITVRGNRKYTIFREYLDYVNYMNILRESLDKYSNEFEIISYVLMTNHIHLQIETKERHIGILMQRLNGLYAKYFNNKYNYEGHLFQERYLSKIIDSSSYMIELSKYIHLNPVRAKIVENPADYLWSSYNVYMDKRKDDIIHREKILSFFENDNASEHYKKYVENLIEN
ncbi:transposase [Clostridium butyricum]|uniref:transposase n=1 Tax=Clostridium butyricum TaxID=1492 RepID=UPI0002CBEBC0|nr:transposase [Clostridium butyricum]ALP89760.1 transposase [Clostridium butyricum]ALS16212.1 transposase [Clostridium butyricum]AOR93443.1 transposase [Clostridium butyricum]EMU53875.1 hypothetical protein CBDKU1_21800 [Clostridium butyricum DKU-01]MBZ0311792.1 transposase [Clostridium butyricum]